MVFLGMFMYLQNIFRYELHIIFRNGQCSLCDSVKSNKWMISKFSEIQSYNIVKNT